MDRESWQKIDRIFEAALALPNDERSDFLDQACAGDEGLRKEVETLLAHDRAESFLDTSASAEAARLLAAGKPEALTGQTVGPYQIQKMLGAGGMGEVYLALHRRTNRKVALKLLPASNASDKERVKRFRQEAHTLLALNHPNIVTIYDIEELGDTNIIASEFIEGETLRERLARAPLRFDDALDIAIQIATALTAAHQAGVVHRDIKPENIMLRPDGYAKVLDFGLAKLTERSKTSPDSDLPTMVQVRTDPGIVLGTVKYMSPEQTRGLEVDERTDIFSLGIMFYEMLTGHLPFPGQTKSDVMAAILQNEPPPLARYWPEAPDALEWILTRALTKERDERYQTAKELLADLKRLKRRAEYQAEAERSLPITRDDHVSAAQTVTGRSQNEATAQAGRLPTASSAEYIVSEIKRHKRSVALVLLGVGAGVIALAVGIVFGLTYFNRNRPAADTVAPFSRIKVSRLTTSGKASHAVISPDGKYVVHVTGGPGQQSLQLKHIATGSDTEIVPAGRDNYTALTFSRDGSFVYYTRFSDAEGGVLSQIPVLGGTPKVLGKDVDSAVSFSPDGKQFAFIRGMPVENMDFLMVGTVDGGAERRLVSHRRREMFPAVSMNVWGPAWSPDGEVIAFPFRTSGVEGNARWRLMLVRVKDGQQMSLTADRWSSIGQIAWLPNGSGLMVIAAEQAPELLHQLWHVSYPGGEAQRITNDLNNYDGVSLTADASSLVTIQNEQRASIWIAPTGEASGALQVPSESNDGRSGLTWTPDGRIVYVSTASGNADIWIMDANGSNRRQLTFSDSLDSAPAVSADGRYIAFVTNRSGANNVWRMEIDGSNPKQLTNGGSDVQPSCSADSQWVVYSSTVSGQRQLWKVPIEGGAPGPVTDYATSLPVVSPDGRLIAAAYIDERQTPIRYYTAVIPFAGGARPVKQFEFPHSFQQVVRWTSDSRGLTYLVTTAGVSNIWRQSVAGGEPSPLTDFKTETIFRYDWSRDGKHLALARGTVISDVVLVTAVR